MQGTVFCGTPFSLRRNRMARFCVLASSSAGNSTYISCGEGALLVDAGISCRRISRSLADLGEELGKIAGILLTHEHADHVKGLRILTKNTGAPVYATAPVLRYLEENALVDPRSKLVEVGPRPFAAAEIEVSAYATPHDSVGSVGYRFLLPGGQKIAVATDLGQVTGEVYDGVRGCDLALLEANYDPELLRMGRYPYFLKRRISGNDGHLANPSCAEFACGLLESGTTRLILGHLSRENNCPALAEQTVDDALRRAGARRGIDYELSVAPYDEPGRLVRL